MVLSVLLLLTAPALAESLPARHGISVFGDLKYKPDFTHFEYANPNAPKGGVIRLRAIDTFETVNPFILKGRKEGWNGLVFDTLMARAGDEPDALYGLVAKTVELPPDRSWVAFNIDPRARFHDGAPVTAAGMLSPGDDISLAFKDDGRAEAVVSSVGPGGSAPPQSHATKKKPKTKRKPPSDDSQGSLL